MTDNQKCGFIFQSHSDEKTSNAECSASNAESNHLLAALAAATILSKRLSPRKSSQHGLKRRSPQDGPVGIFATISSCSSAACHARARRTSHMGKRLLRCEGGDDFLEARITTQPISKRHQFQLAIAINAYKPPHVPDQTLPVSNDGLAIVARHAVAKRYKEENYYLQSTDKLSKNTVASPLAFIVICAISCTK